MTTYVALLYSIVLPKGRLIMADLKDVAAGIGLENPRTLVATGNLLFEAHGTTEAALERELEKAFAARFGKHVDIIVRDAARWRKTVAANPFPGDDTDKVMVRVMRTPLQDDILETLERYRPADDQICVAGGDLWVKFGGKPSESRLLGALTTKRLGIGTSRIWNTVRRLGEMLDD